MRVSGWVRKRNESYPAREVPLPRPNMEPIRRLMLIRLPQPAASQPLPKSEKRIHVKTGSIQIQTFFFPTFDRGRLWEQFALLKRSQPTRIPTKY